MSTLPITIPSSISSAKILPAEAAVRTVSWKDGKVSWCGDLGVPGEGLWEGEEGRGTAGGSCKAVGSAIKG